MTEYILQNNDNGLIIEKFAITYRSTEFLDYLKTQESQERPHLTKSHSLLLTILHLLIS